MFKPSLISSVLGEPCLSLTVISSRELSRITPSSTARKQSFEQVFGIGAFFKCNPVIFGRLLLTLAETFAVGGGAGGQSSSLRLLAQSGRQSFKDDVEHFFIKRLIALMHLLEVFFNKFCSEAILQLNPDSLDGVLDT